MRRAQVGLHMVIGLGLAAAGCAEEAQEVDEGVLSVATADEGALVASITVGGEQVTVSSMVDGDTRHIQIENDSGTSYAEWHMLVADMNTYGSYGDHAFGRPEDMDTDGDRAAWAAVVDSRVGEVLEAVSDAAEVALEDPDTAAAADELRAISRIYPSLETLAGVAAEVQTTGCWFGDGNYGITNTCSEGTSKVQGWTSRPNGSCTRTYYVQLYRESPWTYLDGDGTADGDWWKAFAWYAKVISGFHVYQSKHWDSLNPGSPIWLKRGLQCLPS